MKLFKNFAIMALAAFAFNACEDVPAPYTLPGENTGGSTLPEGVYISESFANSFGTFSTQETEGNYPWVIDYGTAKATSYADGANNAAQSWLVSEPVDFTNETEAYVSFDYIIRYAESGKVAANHQLLVSTDYTGDAATATWTDLPYKAVEGADWQTFYKASVSVPAQFMGKANVTFALKYTAKAKAGTWEVKNLVVAHGKAEGSASGEGEYINETFATDFGAFTLAQTVGNYPWIIDYSTAKATSYVDGVNNAAESWLISPAVDFGEETEAYVKFEYIIRYAESGKVAANHQLLISSDYAGDPATATWTDVPYNATEGVDWVTFAKAHVAVPEAFLGKSSVTFALKYTAKEKAGTWEVRNFIVAHGAVVEDEKPEVKEYTVDEAKAAFVAGESLPAIVKCYIVGTINGQVYSDGCTFSASATANTNLLIAASPDETNPDNCMPVQLPSGAVRSALNLVDNPKNYKREIKLTGNIEKYFGVAGLKGVSAYEFVGDATDEPELPEGVSSISSVIAAGAGAATVQGTIVATYARGFLVNDGTGTILVYLGEDKGYSEGDVVKVSGETTLYAGLLQFPNTSTIEKVGTAAVNHPSVSEMNGAAMDSYLESPSVKYIRYRGVLTIDGYYYNVEIDGAETAVGSISYPKEGLIDASLNGKEVIVTGYAIGVSRSEFVNTMAISVEAADGSTTPDEGEGEEGEDNNDDASGDATIFDFTNPTALTPSVTPAEIEEGATQGAGVEFNEITFTNGNVSIKVAQGAAGTPVRFWTKTDGTVELRTYKNSKITISTTDGNMSSIVFDGYKVSTMSPSTGSFDNGNWSGNANSVTFDVTATLNIKTITVK